MNASPVPASEVEVDEGSPVGEVKHHDGAFQPNVFEAPKCRTRVEPKAQCAHLVVVCSSAVGSVLARRCPSEGGAPLESPMGSGSVVRKRPLKGPCPQQEAERVDDPHDLRFCRTRR